MIWKGADFDISIVSRGWLVRGPAARKKEGVVGAGEERLQLVEFPDGRRTKQRRTTGRIRLIRHKRLTNVSLAKRLAPFFFTLFKTHTKSKCMVDIRISIPRLHLTMTTTIRQEKTSLETLHLYTKECFDVLVHACAKAEKSALPSSLNEPVAVAHKPSSSTFEFFDQSDDEKESGDEGAGSDSESSSSSVEDGGGEAKASSPGGDAEETPIAAASDDPSRKEDAPPPSLPIQPKAKPKPKDQKQRQREQEIKHHSMNLNRMSLPLDESTALHLPVALLSRPQQQEPSMWSKGQAFCDLASQIGPSHKKPVVVLLLRSGRFAAAAFVGADCVKHTSSQRYTVRKGQGKAQSSQDGKRRPKSMGSQLRRAGEQSLKEDIHAVLQEWNNACIQQAGLILVSCPKTMRSTLFELETILPRNDPRLRSIPFDVGRPTFEAACIVHGAMMTVFVGEPSAFAGRGVDQEPALLDDEPVSRPLPPVKEIKEEEAVVEPEIVPLTKLHEAAKDGNLSLLLDLLRENPDSLLIDQQAGYDFMTPLHFAAESTANVDPVTAAACVSTLLIQGHADPTQVDARLRVPYFLALHDKTREAFRKARAILGETYCDWDEAKVGPPLTDEDINAKKEKEAEKKRRKKAKQKEKKAKDQAAAEELEKRRQEQELQEQQAEEAKRIRDALPPKAVRADNVCDFCQTEVKGRKRLQMFKRLDYNYCSSECVQNHKRELMAKAAMDRFK